MLSAAGGIDRRNRHVFRPNSTSPVSRHRAADVVRLSRRLRRQRFAGAAVPAQGPVSSRAPPATRLVAVTVDHGLRAEVRRRGAGSRGTLPRATASRTGRALDRARSRRAAFRLRRARRATGCSPRRRRRKAPTSCSPAIRSTTRSRRSRCASARGEGRGLAGMAPATLFDGRIWIVRPLLAARREALRDFLLRSGIGWVDDPSNVDGNTSAPGCVRRANRWPRRLSSLARPTGRGPGEAQLRGWQSGSDKREAGTRRGRRVALGEAAAASSARMRGLRARPGRARSRLCRVPATRTRRSMRCASCSRPPAAASSFRTLRAAPPLFGRLGDAGWRATLSRAVVDVAAHRHLSAPRAARAARDGDAL